MIVIQHNHETETRCWTYNVYARAINKVRETYHPPLVKVTRKATEICNKRDYKAKPKKQESQGRI